MLPRVTQVRPLDGFELELTFSDGTVGVVDAARWIVGHGGVFGPLNDPEFFRRVVVDAEAGTIVWPNGADLCPDVLYELARPAAASSAA
jgi:hypothetical protein